MDLDKRIDEITRSPVEIADIYNEAYMQALERQGFTMDYLKNADCSRIVQYTEDGREEKFYVNGRLAVKGILSNSGEITIITNVKSRG